MAFGQLELIAALTTSPDLWRTAGGAMLRAL